MPHTLIIYLPHGDDLEVWFLVPNKVLNREHPNVLKALEDWNSPDDEKDNNARKVLNQAAYPAFGNIVDRMCPKFPTGPLVEFHIDIRGCLEAEISRVFLLR